MIDPANTNVAMTVAQMVALGLNTIAILGIAWRGGKIEGRIETIVSSVVEEVQALRITRDEHIGVMARVVSQLDAMDRRVIALERRAEHRSSDDLRT